MIPGAAGHLAVDGVFFISRGDFRSQTFEITSQLKEDLMAYERTDGRTHDEGRAIRITKNYLSHPVASVLMETGGTKVICSVSFEPGVPPWMRAQNVSGGWVTCVYGMIPGSTGSRVSREASKGKQSGRTMEIQRLIGRSFRSVVDLEALGANTVYIDCDVIDADGGTRCASISGASVALQLAFQKLVADGTLERNPMRENVAAISVGIVNGEPLLDLCYVEDSAADVDMNVIMTESGKFVEIQGTAEEEPFSRDELNTLLDLAKKGTDAIFAAQREAVQDGDFQQS
jgi:ribonuclease PH